MPSKKLFLLDAFALIYRAHFAFIKNPRVTSTGFNTSAIYGFANTLIEVLRKEKPTHIAVCFDNKAPTFRHVEYPEYKANREAQPEDITTAIPYIKKLIKAMNIHTMELEGYEADDIIGTIAKKAAREDFEVYMYTPDKDYGQLVEENIYIYKPAFMGNAIEVQGVPEVLNKWGVSRIDQVIDMLGLMGDKVDNIPGIMGVGQKTAQKLLEKYDNVEGILEHAHEVKGKMGEKIMAGKADAILSKRLATIELNVPVEFNEKDLLKEEYDVEQVSELLDELEFKTLKNRLLGTTSTSTTSKKPSANAMGAQMSMFDAQASSNTDANDAEEEVYVRPEIGSIKTRPHNYYCMDTAEKRQELIKFLGAQTEFAFDTETTDIDATIAEIVGLSFAYRAGEAYYVPCPEDFEAAKSVVQEFAAVFANDKIGKIAQNMKYDITILKSYDVEVNGPMYDTMLAHYLVEPDQRHGMDHLADMYLNYETVKISELIGKGKKQGNMRDVALDLITEYAAEDADITLQLKGPIYKQVTETNQDDLLLNVELPLVKVLSSMELEGIKIDVDALKELSNTLNVDLLEAQDQIYKISGQEFNVGSPKQLGEVLFDVMKIDEKAKKTASGQYATGESILLKYEADHEIVRKILDFRELSKLKSTYVDALPLLISPKTGRIHTSYNQAVAATGRLSSTNPNLQNIPIRTERGREIRKAFIPTDASHKILAADYSQIELRIMAALSKDESMLNAFENDIDIHSTTASKVFKVDLEEVTTDMRRKAKMVNFGIIYGISAFGLAQRLSISRTEAKDIIDAYFVEFPSVKRYMDECINNAREKEYVETVLGRRRYLADINSRNQTNRGFAERNAINAPIQGSAADMIKVAMINIHDWMKKENLKSKMMLQVHDELVFDAHESEIDLLKEKVHELMVTAIKFDVKMDTGIGIGENWLEAH